MTSKSDLRKSARMSVPESAHRAALSLKLCDQIRVLEQFKSARRVCLYSARPQEISVFSLWDHSGRFLFPKVTGENLSFGQVDRLESLRPGAFGILEPPETSPIDWNNQDFVLVPGLMFDNHGARLGSGKGFYDRFLSGKNVYKCGVCWDQQLSLAPLPVETFDVPMDRVCTPVRTIKVAGS